MLLAPDGGLSVLPYLTVQDAVDAPVESLGSQGAERIGERMLEGGGMLGYLPQKLHDILHGVVVEGDVGMIVVAARPVLWPSPIGVLHMQQILDATHGGMEIGGIPRCLEEAHEETYLRDGGAVVDGAFVDIERPHAMFAEEIDDLGPAACRELERHHVAGHISGFGL